jgi:hypothetical protein
MAGDVPAAFERIGEGEGVRAGLHLSAMIERPRRDHDRGAPGMASRGGKVPVDDAMSSRRALIVDNCKQGGG